MIIMTCPGASGCSSRSSPHVVVLVVDATRCHWLFLHYELKKAVTLFHLFLFKAKYFKAGEVGTPHLTVSFKQTPNTLAQPTDQGVPRLLACKSEEKHTSRARRLSTCDLIALLLFSLTNRQSAGGSLLPPRQARRVGVRLHASPLDRGTVHSAPG